VNIARSAEPRGARKVQKMCGKEDRKVGGENMENQNPYEPKKVINYQELIQRLERSSDSVCIEVAEALQILLVENKNLKESYDAMFRDLQREIDKNREISQSKKV